MDKQELQERSLKFAVDMRLVSERVRILPGGRNAADQLVDCATSVGANYRAACRGRSRAEFIAKLGTVVEECDEAVYWLEYIERTRILPVTELADLLDEASCARSSPLHMARHEPTTGARSSNNSARPPNQNIAKSPNSKIPKSRDRQITTSS